MLICRGERFSYSGVVELAKLGFPLLVWVVHGSQFSVHSRVAALICANLRNLSIYTS